MNKLSIIWIWTAFLLLCLSAAAEQFQYVYDETGQLIKAIDSTGTVIEYEYDQVGNLREIRRLIVDGLAIFGIAPTQGFEGAKVTIQGQGFHTSPAGNIVDFDGIIADAPSSATENLLVVEVPVGASTGPVTVTVGDESAESKVDFIVIGIPVVFAVDPGLWVDDSILPDFVVNGANLIDATYQFEPSGLSATPAALRPQGESIVLNVTIPDGLLGDFVVVVSNPAGASDSTPTVANTLSIVDADGDPDFDGLLNSEEIALCTDPFNGDSDGDGFGDGDELGAGSDPCLGTDLPVDLDDVALEAVSLAAAILNVTRPPGLFVGEVGSRRVSVLNGLMPNDATLPGEVAGRPFSVENTAAP